MYLQLSEYLAFTHNREITAHFTFYLIIYTFCTLRNNSTAQESLWLGARWAALNPIWKLSSEMFLLVQKAWVGFSVGLMTCLHLHLHTQTCHSFAFNFRVFIRPGVVASTYNLSTLGNGSGRIA